MDEACPMPTPKSSPEQDAILAMLAARRIAVVGMTADPTRAGHYVPAFLRQRGVEILPVTPTYAEIDGLTCFPTLADLPAGDIDVVLVFRRPEFCPEIARQAV